MELGGSAQVRLIQTHRSVNPRTLPPVPRSFLNWGDSLTKQPTAGGVVHGQQGGQGAHLVRGGLVARPILDSSVVSLGVVTRGYSTTGVPYLPLVWVEVRGR